MAKTPNLGLPRLEEGQTQAEIVVNEAFNFLDAMGYFVGITQQTTPPTSPSAGDWYLIAGSGAAGEWALKENQIAGWDGGWIFIPPRKGMRFYRQTDDDELRFTGSTWA